MTGAAMTEQTLLDLDPNYRPAHNHDPETSHQALDDATASGKIDAMRDIVARTLQSVGEHGCIDDELHEVVSRSFPGEQRHVVATRRLELCKAGWVRQSGERRDNKRGSSCVVWVWAPGPPEPSVNEKASADRFTRMERTLVSILAALHDLQRRVPGGEA